MKGIIPISKFAVGLRESTGAKGSDVFLKEIDCGSAQNGTLLLLVDTIVAASDLANIDIWTSNVSDFGSSGTQITAVASDSRAQIVLTLDSSNVEQITDFENTISDVAISSNKITAINQAGLYVFNCKDLARYLKVQYDSDGTGGKVSQAFIGHDLLEGPFQTDRSEY